MFKVIFSDGHSLTVKAACADGARSAAYRLEKVFSIVGDPIPVDA